MISDATNKRIGKNKPSDYLEKMKQVLESEEKVEDVLETHLINKEAFEAMKDNNYEKFLEAREKFIKNEMKNRIKI